MLEHGISWIIHSPRNESSSRRSLTAASAVSKQIGLNRAVVGKSTVGEAKFVYRACTPEEIEKMELKCGEAAPH